LRFDLPNSYLIAGSGVEKGGRDISIRQTEIGGQGYDNTHGCRESGADSKRHYGENDKDNCQGDGKLEKGFFHAPLGAVDRIRLAEDTPQATALYLKQGNEYQGYGDDDLRDI